MVKENFTWSNSFWHNSGSYYVLSKCLEDHWFWKEGSIIHGPRNAKIIKELTNSLSSTILSSYISLNSRNTTQHSGLRAWRILLLHPNNQQKGPIVSDSLTVYKNKCVTSISFSIKEEMLRFMIVVMEDSIVPGSMTWQEGFAS